MANTNEALLPIVSLAQSAMTAPAHSVPSKPENSPAHPPSSAATASQPQLQELVSTVLQIAPVTSTKHDRTCNNEELSDDTAEVEDSGSEGTYTEEPAAKRVRLGQDAKVGLTNCVKPGPVLVQLAPVQEIFGCERNVEVVN